MLTLLVTQYGQSFVREVQSTIQDSITEMEPGDKPDEAWITEQLVVVGLDMSKGNSSEDSEGDISD